MSSNKCVAITLKGSQCKNSKNKEYGEYCGIHKNKNTNTNTTEECSVCYETIRTYKVSLSCKHSYCTGCINNWLLSNPTCPLCRTKVSTEELRNASEWGFINNKVNKIHVITYSCGDDVISQNEQLTFLEYVTVWFDSDRTYNSRDWNNLIQYIAHDDDIYNIFKKMKVSTQYRYILKSEMKEIVPNISNCYVFYTFDF
jgi:hypothetical protein